LIAANAKKMVGFGERFHDERRGLGQKIGRMVCKYKVGNVSTTLTDVRRTREFGILIRIEALKIMVVFEAVYVLESRAVWVVRISENTTVLSNIIGANPPHPGCAHTSQ
jgi:hypothetical protein